MIIDPSPLLFNYDLALFVAHVGIFEFSFTCNVSLEHPVRRDSLPSRAILNRGFHQQLISSATHIINEVADSLILNLVVSLELRTEVLIEGP